VSEPEVTAVLAKARRRAARAAAAETTGTSEEASAVALPALVHGARSGYNHEDRNIVFGVVCCGIKGV